MIGGSPSLIKNGSINIDHKVDGDTSRHPRSAIAVTEDELILFTVDGRRPLKGYKGLTIQELAEYMHKLGCIHAIALDGGGSTHLLHKGKPINSPLENRSIHNAIGVWIK